MCMRMWWAPRKFRGPIHPPITHVAFTSFVFLFFVAICCFFASFFNAFFALVVVYVHCFVQFQAVCWEGQAVQLWLYNYLLPANTELIRL